MTQAKSMYARDARNLKPYQYAGKPVPPRANGFGSPLETGETVYLEDHEAQVGYVIVNCRRDGFGASFRLRLRDLREVAS